MYVNKYIQCSIRSGLLKDMMIQMQIQIKVIHVTTSILEYILRLKS